MAMPQSAKYAVIGAGIHGLSTAYHLALSSRRAGAAAARTSSSSTRPAIAAGASGIACGVVRNNYFQPAMRELMAHCVEVWESDAEAYSYHPGRLHADQPGSDARAGRHDLRAAAGDRLSVGVHRGRRRFDELHAGPVRRLAGARASPRSCTRRRAATPTTRASMYGLAAKAEAEGVRIVTGVEVIGFEFGSNCNAVTGARHQPRLDRLRLGGGRRGPLGQPDLGHARPAERIDVKGRDGKLHRRRAECGHTGAWRRARSASTPTCTRPMTAGCRRSSMSTPMRRSIPTSTAR